MPSAITLKSFTAALVAAVLLTAGSPKAQQASDAQALIDKARLTTEKLLKHPDTEPLRGLIKKAKGILIVPSLLKAGFVIGGEGGQGVLLSRDDNGNWSSPAFYDIGSGSVGLQIGFQDSEVIFVIMSQSSLETMIDSNFKLGADASVAAGPFGVGVEGATLTNLNADIISYAISRGAFAGASFEGSVAVEEKSLNTKYYGPGATARSIVLDRRHTNPAAAGLIRALKAK